MWKKTIRDHLEIPSCPIIAKKGHQGTIIEFDGRPEWKGWLQCKLDDGQIGWVSQSFLKITGNRLEFIRDYTAVEIEVRIGEVLEILREDNGWAWVRKENGTEGWVPAQCY